jgi:hypothetical protein
MALADLTFPLEPLNRFTRPGLFASGASSTLHWVFWAPSGPVAVQLTDSVHRPAFSYLELGDPTVAIGTWLGEARVKLGEEYGAWVGRSGQIVGCKTYWYLKVNDDTGQSKRLRMVSHTRKFRDDHSHFYSGWALSTTVSGQIVQVFSNGPELPRLRACRAGKEKHPFFRSTARA